MCNTCKPGKSLCPQAVRLWRKANLLYANWQTKPTVANWLAYKKAADAYGEHFKKKGD